MKSKYLEEVFIASAPDWSMFIEREGKPTSMTELA